MGEPALLRIPEQFQTARDVLGCADKMDLPNVLVLSEREDGTLVFLSTEMTLAQANWLLDRFKALMVG
jgi:hypothetical protein